MRAAIWIVIAWPIGVLLAVWMTLRHHRIDDPLPPLLPIYRKGDWETVG
jgi:hypothetical protein